MDVFPSESTPQGRNHLKKRQVGFPRAIFKTTINILQGMRTIYNGLSHRKSSSTPKRKADTTNNSRPTKKFCGGIERENLKNASCAKVERANDSDLNVRGHKKQLMHKLFDADKNYLDTSKHFIGDPTKISCTRNVAENYFLSKQNFKHLSTNPRTSYDGSFSPFENRAMKNGTMLTSILPNCDKNDQSATNCGGKNCDNNQLEVWYEATQSWDPKRKYDGDKNDLNNSEFYNANDCVDTFLNVGEIAKEPEAANKNMRNEFTNMINAKDTSKSGAVPLLLHRPIRRNIQVESPKMRSFDNHYVCESNITAASKYSEFEKRSRDENSKSPNKRNGSLSPENISGILSDLVLDRIAAYGNLIPNEANETESKSSSAKHIDRDSLLINKPNISQNYEFQSSQKKTSLNPRPINISDDSPKNNNSTTGKKIKHETNFVTSNNKLSTDIVVKNPFDCPKTHDKNNFRGNFPHDADFTKACINDSIDTKSSKVKLLSLKSIKSLSSISVLDRNSNVSTSRDALNFNGTEEITKSNKKDSSCTNRERLQKECSPHVLFDINSKIFQVLHPEVSRNENEHLGCRKTIFAISKTKRFSPESPYCGISRPFRKSKSQANILIKRQSANRRSRL